MGELTDKMLHNSETEVENISITRKHAEVLQDPEILESLLTPLEQYIIRLAVQLNKPFSVGKVHNLLTLSLYALWYDVTKEKTAISSQKAYDLSSFFDKLQKKWLGIGYATYNDVQKMDHPVVLDIGEGPVLAPKPDETTYNFRKAALASEEVGIAIPSFNRIKRALETFTSWGILTTRTAESGKASTLYVMTIAFNKGYRVALDDYFRSEKAQKMRDIVIDILNEEAS